MQNYEPIQPILSRWFHQSKDLTGWSPGKYYPCFFYATSSMFFLIFTVFFTVGTYDYYRGAVFTRYRAGPVSADIFHLSLSDGQLDTNGAVQFKMNVDAGPSAVSSYIVRIELLDPAKTIVETWTATTLRGLPKTAIHNSYQYNKVDVGMYGIIAPESAKAEISLPPTNRHTLSSGHYTLQLYTIDGKRWDLDLTLTTNLKN